MPDALHCWGCVPLQPSALAWHTTHVPPLQTGVPPVQDAPVFCQLPVLSQVCGWAPLHPALPAAHTPWHDADCEPEELPPESIPASTPVSAWPESIGPESTPPSIPPPEVLTTHVWLRQASGVPQLPPVEQLTTPLPEHAVCPGAQEPTQVPLTQV